jgi:predicted CoA-binding protein
MNSGKPTVAVVGASADRAKFGNKAVRAFRDAGWTVYPIHPTLAEVESIPAYPSLDEIPVRSLDRVSLYVPPTIGEKVLDQVARMSVGEVWLNPGTESPSILERARELRIAIIQACSILAVGGDPGRE